MPETGDTGRGRTLPRSRGVSTKTDECTGTRGRSRQGPTYLIAGQPQPFEILRSPACVPAFAPHMKLSPIRLSVRRSSRPGAQQWLLVGPLTTDGELKAEHVVRGEWQKDARTQRKQAASGANSVQIA